MIQHAWAAATGCTRHHGPVGTALLRRRPRLPPCGPNGVHPGRTRRRRKRYGDVISGSAWPTMICSNCGASSSSWRPIRAPRRQWTIRRPATSEQCAFQAGPCSKRAGAYLGEAVTDSAQEMEEAVLLHGVALPGGLRLVARKAVACKLEHQRQGLLLTVRQQSMDETLGHQDRGHKVFLDVCRAPTATAQEVGHEALGVRTVSRRPRGPAGPARPPAPWDMSSAPTKATSDKVGRVTGPAIVVRFAEAQERENRVAQERAHQRLELLPQISVRHTVPSPRCAARSPATPPCSRFSRRSVPRRRAVVGRRRRTFRRA